ncbi:hypothetical protein GCM10022225_45000 [Plantactinospora mayteni]|uniref:Uncharacterized protein n=1 Tax=Plantactinospora mayteni TaxID=566021 RepID=A0ABQ4EXN1_9ACTN|nr:hypothetical protein Pma05_59950 [Plantactinospora mayteni]
MGPPRATPHRGSNALRIEPGSPGQTLCGHFDKYLFEGGPEILCEVAEAMVAGRRSISGR